MGIITRHAGAPYQDGESLAGADLENDFAAAYNAINGNIDSANLADDAVSTSKIAALAVTTAKLASGAVTQAKLTDGAATASEADVSETAFTTSATLTQAGATLTHVVGDPARHVIIMVSFVHQASTIGTGTFGFELRKDGTAIYPNEFINVTVSTGRRTVSRTYVDTSPTPGGTHAYTFWAADSATNGVVRNLVLVAFEPRS